MAGEATAVDATFHIVLFYQYASVPPAPEGAAAAAAADGGAPADPQDVNALQAWLQQRCGELGMLGRVVLATEGINGNLASESLDNVRTFCDELQALQVFKDKPIDFKMDSSSAKPFPDLYIQIKPEICSTGHTMPKELLDKGLGGNHLKPEEFHAVLKEYWEKTKAADGADGPDEESDDKEAKKDLIVIDVRNNVEFNTGRFMAPTGEKEAVNPCTKTFSHWATDYADKAVEELKTKKVLMYCTGGIRCEKASAYLRSKGVEDVSQLSGGIHRYLEKFGADGYFKGSNFVFDSRKLQKPEGAAVVGKCSECEAPTEEVSCDRVCAVCREPVLACDACRVKTFGVYYCALHSDLKGLYEPFLERFEIDELEKQRDGLNELLSTKFKAKGRRRPISKQLRRINEWLERKTAAKEAAEAGTRAMPKRSRFASNPRCRSCGMIGPMDLLSLMGRTPSDDDLCCDGSCTGFAKANYENPKRSLDEMNDPEFGAALCTKKRKRVQKNYRAFAKRMREETRQEYEVTSYNLVPAESSDQGVALRIVKPYFFDFNSYVKKTWEGHPILDMYTKFFTGNKVEYYRRALETGLITVDGVKVGPEKILKNGELLSNLTHRHEPPAAYVPGADMIIADSDGVIAIDKPASVTIHPSGAFRRNSLQFILAVECGLTDIHPIHRLDRHTSGIVLFAKNPTIAKKLTDAMMRKGEVGATSKISKAYLARVHGRFPASAAELEASCGQLGLHFVQHSQRTAAEQASPVPQGPPPGDGAGRPSKGDDSAEYLAAVALRANGLHWVEDESDPMLELSGCTLDPAKAAQPRGGHVVVSWPLEPACMNTGTWRCCSSEDAAGKSGKAKQAMSRLRLLAYDPGTDTSLVQCEPITGRTHQLRVHLAFAGHPILHDPLYGRGGDAFAGLTQRESEQSEQERNSKLVDATLPSAEELAGLAREEVACRLCAVCTEGEEVAFKPVQLRVQGVDLHAFRYKVDLADGSTFDFSTKLPPFAKGFAAPAKH